MKKFNEQGQRKILGAMKEYCEASGLDYDEMYESLSGGNENKWLSEMLGKKKVTFEDLCEYISEPEIYNDFKSAGSFVHAPDAPPHI